MEKPKFEEPLEKDVPESGLGENWNKSVNEKVIESEIEGGAWLEKLEIGKKLKVNTRNSTYTIEHREDGFYISGHPKYCPEPTKLKRIGSTWGGSMIKHNYVGRGMILEFQLLNREGPPINTSEIKEVEEIS